MVIIHKQTEKNIAAFNLNVEFNVNLPDIANFPLTPNAVGGIIISASEKYLQTRL